jgi:hypothetical protein
MSKTSTQIINEAVKNYDNYLSSIFPSLDRFLIHESLNQLRSALEQAMKTAVEEVTPEEAKLYQVFDGLGFTEDNDEVESWNNCISEMEEKKRKFFEE